MKRDGLLFAFGIGAAVLALCCMVLQALPLIENREVQAVGSGEIILEKNDLDILTAEFIENDYSELFGKISTQAEPTSSSTPEIAEEHNPVPDSVEMTLSGGVGVSNFFVNQEDGTVDVDFNALLTAPTILQPDDGGITVLLYHTHTCEAYANEEDMTLTRTDDPSKSVVAVGEAMKASLEQEGISVIHDTTIHDVTYTGSYSRSEATVLSYLEQYPEIDIVIDLHRDSLKTSEEKRIRTIAEIGGKKAAQVMILSGCDADGSLGIPNWQENLKLALRMQSQLSAISPDLTRPLFYCNRNYNQNLSAGALLIEVGTDANLLEESVYSGELLGKALARTIQGLKN